LKISRPRLSAALTPAAIGAAAAIVVAAASGVFGTARPAAPARPGVLTAQLATVITTSAGHQPVMVNCLNKQQVRPASFILTCADANSVLIKMSWQTWTQASAYASGTWDVNDCVPNCAEGTFDKFPALVVGWRPELLPGGSGGHYFSRLTFILTGPHCFTAGGKKTCYPITETTSLWSHL
jgi:hypothetical protein